MTHLNSCPFCGSAAELERTLERFEYCTGGPNSVMDYGYIVYCTKCDASMGLINVPPSSPEEATTLWNKRTMSIATQQSEVWEVEDLEFTCGAATIAQIGGEMLVNLYGETLQVTLPDDIRLMRRTASAPQQPAMPTTLGEGKWEPLLATGEKDHRIVMCPEGGELNCYNDGTVVVKEGTRMYLFRLPPGVRLWHDTSSPLANAERQVLEDKIINLENKLREARKWIPPTEVGHGVLSLLIDTANAPGEDEAWSHLNDAPQRPVGSGEIDDKRYQD